MVQTIIVSMKVWVIETSACLTGSGVLAAAAAIGADPRPDSLEKTPLETPSRMVCMIAAPRNPPTAADGVNADLKMRAKIFGRSETLRRIIIKAPVK